MLVDLQVNCLNIKQRICFKSIVLNVYTLVKIVIYLYSFFYFSEIGEAYGTLIV